MPHRHRKPKKVIPWYDKHFTVIITGMVLSTISILLMMYYLYVQSKTPPPPPVEEYKPQYDEKKMRADYILHTGDTSVDDGRASVDAMGSALKDTLKD